MSHAFESRDPRSEEPPEYNDHAIGCRCDECRGILPAGCRFCGLPHQDGRVHEDCRCGANESDPEDPNPTPVTEEYGLVLVCRACDGTGFLSFTDTRYGRGWALLSETIPCACRPAPLMAPLEYARRDALQRSEDYLEARCLPETWPDPPCSEMLAMAIETWSAE